VLTLWEDIRTWIESHESFVFPELAAEIPSNDGYREWKNQETLNPYFLISEAKESHLLAKSSG